MKCAAHGIWRPVRCLLLVACAGGILAADNTWINTFDLDFSSSGSWFSTEPVNDSHTADLALSASQENIPRAQLSMGQLVNGLLFSRPAGSWMLSSSVDEGRSPFGGRITEFDPINQYQRSDNFGSFSAPISTMSAAPHRRAASSTILPTGPGGTTGNWIQNASGDWSTASNWQGGIIPSGANSNAHFDTLNIMTDVNVTLDSSRTVGELYLGDTNGTHHYTIAPSAVTDITFDNSGLASFLQQSSTSAGDTVSIPVFLKNDLNVNNLATAKEFVINSNIASSAATGTLQSLLFNYVVSNPGDIIVAGNITNGTTGATLQVQISGGTVLFGGTNTYSGYTFVNGGTLLVKGDNSGATGFVYVSGSGSVLAGKGSIGGEVQMFGNSTISPGTTTSTGALTLLSNVRIGSNEGSGGIYLANLAGAFSDLLLITGNLVLGFGSTLDIQGTPDGNTTYILAQFASRSGTFQTEMGIPPGYTLVYNADDIELVPTAIPEPSTWIGGALALGAIAFASRRRLCLKT
jgi:autotransporter-associated beta strand protein